MIREGRKRNTNISDGSELLKETVLIANGNKIELSTDLSSKSFVLLDRQFIIFLPYSPYTI